MKFPIIEISDHCWNKRNYKDFHILFTNEMTHIGLGLKTANLEWLEHLLYVDSEGELYRVVGLSELSKSGFLKFLPFIRKQKYDFVKEGSKIPFDELKSLLFARAKEALNDRLADHIEAAKTFSELLDG